ncbi:MAG TPA: FKBP-type peptidyl-prolyl cis-trans isomerase [Nitrospirota bacterium]|nr:FKBP-type peptidyl-prolyl cis-trans isomerase [Nitrospirota bacterium]
MGLFKVNLLTAILGTALLAVQVSAGEPPELKTDKDKVNYAIGVNFIGNIKRQGIDIDLDLVIQGMKDAHTGGKLLLTDDELRKAISKYQVAARQKRSQVGSKVAEESKKAGVAFLAENKKKEGIVALPSGLQYKVHKTGEGKKPTDADTVECHYRGTLINGAEFDSSYRSGKPATFKMSEVIPGWSEALKLMPVGSKWQLFIPPQLAYGERGGGRIGPNTTLIFEIELLGIK